MISSKSIIINKLNNLDINNIIIDVNVSKKYPKSYINGDYKEELNKIKDIVCKYDKWLIYRKLFTSLIFLNFYNKKYNIGIFKKNVLSRSFFKMIEIQNDYNILQFFKYPIKVAFIAEAPGGFIEAFYKLRNNYNDKYYGISLINKSNTIPSWNNIKHKIKKTNLHLLDGYDNTGDIYKLINIINFINTIGKHSCDIVTADGGFDFSNDYINQEYNFIRLFFCEIVLNLNLQKKGGTFIIKCFDLTNIFNLKIFYLLCHLYEKVIITKLKTSRQTNSERYIICKNLKYYLNDSIMKNLFEIILKWDNLIDNNMKIIDIFKFQLDKFFIDNINLYNSWFLQKQLDIYNYIININYNITNSLIKNIIKQHIINNIENSINFCRINNLYIDYNSYFIITNIDTIINTHFNIYI